MGQGRWTETEVDCLVEHGLVEFLPIDHVLLIKRLPWKRQSVLLARFEELISEKRRRQLDYQFHVLRQRTLHKESLLNRTHDAVRQVFADEPHSSLMELGSRYLLARLGFQVSPRTDHSNRGPTQLPHRREELMAASQQDLFREWTELFDDVSHNSAWIECMALRYAVKKRSASDHLPRSLRRELEGQAKKLKRRRIAIDRLSDRDWQNFRTSAIKYVRGLRLSLAKRYFEALLAGPLTREHRLSQPVERSGLFEGFTGPLLEHKDLDPYFAETFERRFQRYLLAAPETTDELIGRVLMELMRRSWSGKLSMEQYGSRILNSEWIGLPGTKDSTPHKDFTTIWRIYKSKLKSYMPTGSMRAATMTQLWENCTELQRRLSIEGETTDEVAVFLAADILKEIDKPTFDLYRRHVRQFRAGLLRDFLNLSRDRRHVPAIWAAAMLPFRASCIRDPLLNAVFHSEMMNGVARLKTHRRVAEFRRRYSSRVVVLVINLLQNIKFNPPHSLKVESVLTDAMPFSDQVRYAIDSTKLPGRRKGAGVFAFAAPLIAAILQDNINLDSVILLYYRHQADPDAADVASSFWKSDSIAHGSRID